MAINIFSGGSSNRNGKPVSNSAAQRAQATTSALKGEAVASTDGTTAVKSSNALATVGNVVNKVSGFLSKAPGLLGTVGSVVNALTSKNDPEWWNSVKGDGVSTNDPLQFTQSGDKVTSTTDGAIGHFRPAILEILSYNDTTHSGLFPSELPFNVVINPTLTMITQYIMPAVRKVANAITLQDGSNYRKAFIIGCTAYAYWQHLKKIDFFLKHGHTYLPNMNDVNFPIMQNRNASWLQSTITRLEDFLRSNVRLPHTMCEYLAWRFGRMYRINASAKAAFVTYSPIPIEATIYDYETNITNLMALATSTTEIQKAMVDIYNAYVSHDQAVMLDPATQCSYDPKEFVLRTNLDLEQSYSGLYDAVSENIILMDSNLDNPTTFMASTVSSIVSDRDGSYSQLFCVTAARAYFYVGTINGFSYAVSANNSRPFTAIHYEDDQSEDGSRTPVTGKISIGWNYKTIASLAYPSNIAPDDPTDLAVGYAELAFVAMLCKALEFYNVGIYLQVAGLLNSDTEVVMIDVTALAQDSANVPDIIIANEQVFAFANLVYEGHRDRTTYKKLDKEAAKVLADTIAEVPHAEITA